MPKDYASKIDEEIRQYHAEWSMDGGKTHTAILEQHYRQIEKITGKTPANDDRSELKKNIDGKGT